MGIVNRTAGDKMIGPAGTREYAVREPCRRLAGGPRREKAADLRTHRVIVAHGHALGGDSGPEIGSSRSFRI